MKSNPFTKIDVIKLRDSLTNLVASIGNEKDKRSFSQFNERSFSRQELESMYKQDWLSGKIIDIVPDDMCRNWRSFSCPSLEEKQLDLIYDIETALKTKSRFNEVYKWARLYGGAIIILGLDGTGEYEEELNLDQVKQGSLKFLHVIDRYDITNYYINEDNPSAPNYRQPEFYTISGDRKSLRVHYSRILRFDGVNLPWRMKQRNQYWGGSVLERVYDAILNSQQTANSVSSMTFESSLNVIGVSGLFNMLSKPGGEDSIIQRFSLANLLKSFNNTLLIDKDTEEFTKQTNSFSGLPDLITRFLNIVAAASDIPATRLLGQSAQGLNATGEGDLKNYYDMISAKQESTFLDPLNYYDQILTRSVLGFYPPDWSTEFNPLWQTSETEQAEIDLKNAQTDQIYDTMAILPASIIAKELRKRGTYGGITDDLIDALEAVETGGDMGGGNSGEIEENNAEIEEITEISGDAE